MQVTYMPNPTGICNVNELSTTIITENLMRDDRIDLNISPAMYMCNYIVSKELPKYVDIFAKVNENYRYLSGEWNKWLQIALTSKECIEHIINTVKGNIVLYSANTGACDYYIIAELLNRGYKLVVGGPTVGLYDFEYSRKVISEYGADNLSNLLLVKGYVDLTTDLHKIIDDWKDTTIESNDFATWWDCKNDYIGSKYNKIIEHVDLAIFKDIQGYIVTIFDSFCPGTCKFCLFKLLPTLDYTKSIEVEAIANNILERCKQSRVNNIFIANNLFLFRDKYKKVLEILKDNGINITIMTSMKLLHNREVIENINKYINHVCIGMESTIDFSLEKIGKENKFNDIQKTVESIINFGNKNINYKFCSICDLPVQSKDQVYENYNNQVEIKETFIKNGFNNFTFVPKTFQIGEATKVMIDGEYIKRCNIDAPDISGRFKVWKMFYEQGLIPKLTTHEAFPFQRLVKSDIDIIDPSVMKFLFK